MKKLFLLFLPLVLLPLHFVEAKSIASAGVVTMGQSSPTGLPVHIKIPKINVNAIVESVGVTTAGIMDVPKQIADTAWYHFGTIPGEIGSAVIDGHSGTMNGVPAVFNDLKKLKIGDKVYIDDGTGTSTSFVVVGIKTFGAKDNTTSVFKSSDNVAHLNLITCEYAVGKNKKSYYNRLIVFTNKEV